MNTSIRKEILRKLGDVGELSPDVRFGQLLANLTFLAEDASDQSMWDIEDEQLLRVLDQHHGDLTKRQPDAARKTG